MSAYPVFCLRDTRAGTACTDLAVVRISAQGRERRSATACPEHRAAVERWAGAVGPITVTPITQPGDAVRGDGQGALFKIGSI